MYIDINGNLEGKDIKLGAVMFYTFHLDFLRGGKSIDEKRL
jgi:hypothetical protein